LNSENEKNTEAKSASEASLLFEIQKIEKKTAQLEEILNKIYSALDIRLGSDEVKRIFELKGALDESMGWVNDIRKTNEDLSQSMQDIKEKISLLESVNRENEENITSLRSYILNTGPTVYDLAGLIGAFALIVTSILIYRDAWQVVRAWYYPLIFGILLAGAAGSTLLGQRKIKKRLFSASAARGDK
jgi:tetrahydromethanopterin S-methyltransferase subunit B